jgi:uncharacterized protein with HEPN domain
LPFRDNATHLQDIFGALDHIETFVVGLTFEAYKADQKTKSAVERQMQILSEAAIRLGADAETIAPALDWEGLRGMGNLLRHAYHRIDDQIIWDTVKDKLPLMREVILKVLRSNNPV